MEGSGGSVGKGRPDESRDGEAQSWEACIWRGIASRSGRGTGSVWVVRGEGAGMASDVGNERGTKRSQRPQPRYQ